MFAARDNIARQLLPRLGESAGRPALRRPDGQGISALLRTFYRKKCVSCTAMRNERALARSLSRDDMTIKRARRIS